MTTKTAIRVRKLTDFTGDAALYKLTPPLRESEEGISEYVIVSATVAYSGPETYIFPATEDGDVLNWGELPGSYRGGLSHAEALEGAGYSIP